MNGEMPIRKKRIAFVLFDYPLLVSTMVINSIALLARENNVDVITSESRIDRSSCDFWLLNLIVAPLSALYHRLIIFSISKLFRGISYLIPNRFPFIKWYLGKMDLIIFSYWLRSWFKSHDYDIIVPVECLSLIAVNMARTGREDLIYYNMELLDWSEENPLYRNKLTLKNLEFDAIKSATHVMITSPERARIFSEINNFPKNQISVLPILPLHQSSIKKTRFFREKFSIADDCMVVIYSGNFMPWAMCLEIIKSMDTWPRDTVLVMHTWNKNTLSSEYFQEMKKAAENHRVFFSSDFLCHDDLAPALSSADVGLLFYESLDANFTEILFSSNKMAEYIAAGIPVICSPFPSLQSFVEEHGIGKSADFPEIGDVLLLIQSEKEKYRQNVDLCRRNYFEFEPYFYRSFSEYLNDKSKRM